MPPTLANGKICYVELPANDIAQSAAFYSKVFGWVVRTRNDGSTAFDDTTGEVSGAFALGRDVWAGAVQIRFLRAGLGVHQTARAT